MRKLAICAAVGIMATGGFAEVLDRPSGIKIGQRMTLRPYVSLSATYDSNVNAYNSSSGDNDDVIWTVNPAFSLDYKGENWSLLLNGYYNYRAYSKNQNVNTYNQHSYGETLRLNYATSRGNEKGWTLMLAESFRQITMTDDISYGDGTAFSADRYEFTTSGGVQRRFNEKWHAGASASYYLVDYENDTARSRHAYYGWERWSAGLDGGFAPSKWLDIIGTLGYQGYQQDNVSGSLISQESQGYSAQAGIGSYATERISYRILGGWSRFDYAGGASTADGFVYTISGNWRISDTLNTMLLATSYYQPSERQHSSQSRVDSVSWGIAKSWVRNKLRTSFDLTYRRTTHESVNNYSSVDYQVDVATARISANYVLNRFLTAFVSGEYQQSWNDQSERMNSYCDYDRWRTSIGLRLTY